MRSDTELTEYYGAYMKKKKAVFAVSAPELRDLYKDMHT